MKIAGVVILYYPKKEYISNVLQYSKSVDKLFVIDNSPKKANIIFPKNVEYLHKKENIGIAKSLNIAAKKAIANNYKWMLTLDQDSIIKSDDIKKLLKYISTTKIKNLGIVSPYQVTLKKDNSNILEEEMMEVMTSGNIINLVAYNKIGGYDENLFIDGVDTEYCLRLNKNNYKIIRLNNVKIRHSLGQQRIINFFNKQIICSNHNAIRRYYMFRNMLYIYSKYNNDFPKYVNFLKKVQFGQIKRIILFEKDKCSKIKYIYLGYKDFKNNRMGKLEENNVK